jgi:hypothetical protein
LSCQQHDLTLLCRAGTAMVSVPGIRIVGHYYFSFSLSLALPVLVAPGADFSRCHFTAQSDCAQ